MGPFPIIRDRSALQVFTGTFPQTNRHGRVTLGHDNEEAPGAAAKRLLVLVEAQPNGIASFVATMLPKRAALVIGTEAMVVFKDVLRLDDADARKVKRWAIRALAEAARKPGASC